MGHGKKERKRHDLVLEKLHMTRDVENEDRMKRVDFINKCLISSSTQSSEKW